MSEVKKRKTSPEDAQEAVAPVPNLLVKRLSDKAKLPTRGSALAAGYDLYRRVEALVEMTRSQSCFCP
jgi:dUTP pyrophosphatase